MTDTLAIPPGGTIGIFGGGQLGRMTALAAARLGYRTHIFATEPDSPAAQVSARATVADYADGAAVDGFAAAVDVITFEFENIPVETVRRAAARVPVHPSAEILEITQDRLSEKDFLRGIGVATTDYRAVADLASLAQAVHDIGAAAVLKTARLGYDGKGQVMLKPDLPAEDAWRRIGGAPAILERLVDFACEISVIVARGGDGDDATFVAVENRHRNHILDTTIAPARISAALATQAEAVAHRVAERLGLVGVLAVEMFVTRAGEILVNELAPRPHNSGHWTIDACATSQFEQLVRAVCGLPLGSPERHADAVMRNLIGAGVETWRDALLNPVERLHLYGKDEAKPGRKMGHVTRLQPRRSG